MAYRKGGHLGNVTAIIDFLVPMLLLSLERKGEGYNYIRMLINRPPRLHVIQTRLRISCTQYLPPSLYTDMHVTCFGMSHIKLKYVSLHFLMLHRLFTPTKHFPLSGHEYRQLFMLALFPAYILQSMVIHADMCQTRSGSPHTGTVGQQVVSFHLGGIE